MSLGTELDLCEMEVIILHTIPAKFRLAFSTLDIWTSSVFINNGLTKRTRLASGYFIQVRHGLVKELNYKAFLLVTLIALGYPLSAAFFALKWEFAVLLSL